MPLTFVTGPVRSGKSRFAEALARDAGGEIVYVATAARDAADAEWQRRLAHHVARRPSAWRTVETAVEGAVALDAFLRAATPAQTLLVDSLGTWLADRMSRRFAWGGDVAATDEDALEGEMRSVVDAARATRAHAIVVGEEVGWGLVPPYPSGRVFRDVLGRAQQALALGAQRSFLVVAAHAIDLAAARPVALDSSEAP